MEHRTHRVRHNSRRRTLEVQEKWHVTPRMLRMGLGGEDFEDFTSARRARLHHQHQTPSGAMAPGNGILGRRPGGYLRTAGQLVSPRFVSILRNHRLNGRLGERVRPNPLCRAHPVT
jgi:hypothetical protein